MGLSVYQILSSNTDHITPNSHTRVQSQGLILLDLEDGEFSVAVWHVESSLVYRIRDGIVHQLAEGVEGVKCQGSGIMIEEGGGGGGEGEIVKYVVRIEG